jgi:hypothetical protein
MLAEGKVAARVLARVKALSALYGTKMQVAKNAGVIRLGRARR